MLAAGKAKKVALVAVMNKFLKQVFGIVQSGQDYCVNCWLLPQKTYEKTCFSTQFIKNVIMIVLVG